MVPPYHTIPHEARGRHKVIITCPSKADPTLPYHTSMPLVKLFARNTLQKAIPLARLQTKLCEIWGTKPSTTKLMLFRCEDWTDESFQEDVYVDIRAYGKPERTREFVMEGMVNVQKAFAEEGLTANLRLETYEGERYFHVPPQNK